jgi:hypothetical protein
VGFALLMTGYFLVILPSDTGYLSQILTGFQIQFLVNPFHRMFSLDDLRISFPHAEVERVPLCKEKCLPH